MQINFKYTIKTVDVRGIEKKDVIIHPWLYDGYPPKKSLSKMACHFAKETLMALSRKKEKVNVVLREIVMRPSNDEIIEVYNTNRKSTE